MGFLRRSLFCEASDEHGGFRLRPDPQLGKGLLTAVQGASGGGVVTGGVVCGDQESVRRFVPRVGAERAACQLHDFVASAGREQEFPGATRRADVAGA
jgi:hypothetical protein